MRLDKNIKQKIIEKIEYVLLIIILLILWVSMDKAGKLNTVIFPSPKTILTSLMQKIEDGSLLTSLSISVVRVLKGYLLACIGGIILGIIIGLSNHMQRLSEWIIHILRPIPPIAWIPIAIMWMGIGESSKVFLIFLGGFFTILINVIDGIRYIDEDLLEVAKGLETPKVKYVVQVILMAALPNIFTGMRVALGTCWACVVAAELVAASSGIGYMISSARNFGQMDIVIIGMLTIGLVGKLMDVVLTFIEKRVLSWKL